MSLPYTSFNLNVIANTIPASLVPILKSGIANQNDIQIHNGKLYATYVMQNNGRTNFTGIMILIFDPVTWHYNLYADSSVNFSTDRSYAGSTYVRIVSNTISILIGNGDWYQFPIPNFVQSDIIERYPITHIFNGTYPIPTCAYSSIVGPTLYQFDPKSLNEYWNIQYFIPSYGSSKQSIIINQGSQISNYHGASAITTQLFWGLQAGAGLDPGASAQVAQIINGEQLAISSTTGNVYNISINSNWPIGSIASCYPQTTAGNISLGSNEIFSCQVADNFFNSPIDNNLIQFSYGSSFNWFIFSSLYYNFQIAYRSFQQQSNNASFFMGGKIYTMNPHSTGLQFLTHDNTIPIIIPNYQSEYYQSGSSFLDSSPSKFAQVKTANYLINHSRPISAIGAYKT